MSKLVPVLLVLFVAVAGGAIVPREDEQPVVWAGGICGDCPGNCFDVCTAERDDCLAQGGSSCESKYQSCLEWCDN